MIVRTYGRRSRPISRSYSDSDFNDGFDDTTFRDSLSQESPKELCNMAYSSQDSTHWTFDAELYSLNSSQNSLSIIPPRVPVVSSDKNIIIRKLKKPRNGRRELEEPKISKGIRSVSMSLLPTSTLMETQEFGEMMEHVDEVNFALDGLRKLQPAIIRRASLLSLLSICSTVQQRRFLKTQGLAKTIIDAMLGLSFDDPPSNLAAAALFYVLTSDDQDDHLLNSPQCIQFLLTLLKPLAHDAAEDRRPTIGSKLLALRKGVDISRNTTKRLDSSSTATKLKVQEILRSCKDLKLNNEGDNGSGRPELSPKWIALLTIEKACLTTISLEDASGTVKKIGGNFKEKLRDLGGLDAVFDVAVNCHSTMEGWLRQKSPSTSESNGEVDLETLALLLKCMKIMENATFLSKDNQTHLLAIKGKLDCEGCPLTFTRLIISVIKILSGLSLLRSSKIPSKEKSNSLSYGIGNASAVVLMEESRGNGDENLASCSSEKSYNVSQKGRWLSNIRFSCTTSSLATASTSSSCSGTRVKKKTKRPNFDEETNFELLEESQDPFAFDDVDEPTKWDKLFREKKAPQTRKRRIKYREESALQFQLMSSQEESSNVENHHSCEISNSTSTNEEYSNLVADCLLTAVKVLMNLTNDNSIGCQQIAACGGLETMASLIADHFPSFSSSSLSETKRENSSSKSTVELENQNDRHLSDQELDFLVAILGLLVNLVEKDGRNRSRLASASVLLPSIGRLDEERCEDLIQLLCSIFLASQGAGEAVGEANILPWNEEVALLQGEKEAEKMILEAYAALLLAFLSTESRSTREAIANALPGHNMAILVPVLERFVTFHLTLDMISPETHKAVTEVIESCRVP